MTVPPGYTFVAAQDGDAIGDVGMIVGRAPDQEEATASHSNVARPRITVSGK